MKVCFYLDNEKLKGVDFSNPTKGNPGIGGTHFMIWTVSYYLKKIYDDLDIVILANIIEQMPIDIECKKCNNYIEAIQMAKKIEADIIVLRGPLESKEIFDEIDKFKIKTLMWCHNFEGVKYLNLANECNYLKRNICVGKEQYDRLRDHKIFRKSIYIHNCIDFNNYNKIVDVMQKDNIVCYLGSIDETKGFHKLAEIWKKVVDKVPSAKLYVIGSGKLYDKEKGLGRYNIADKIYENKFMKYLVNDNGEIIESVKFLGILNGKNKIEVISKSKVGITNPTGFGETFCISAIEFQALGVPIITAKTNGLLETVDNNMSGLLVKNKKQLLNSIIHLLENNEMNLKMSYYAKEYVRDNFDIYSICAEWKKMLYEVYNDINVVQELKTKNYSDNLKWLREVNRILKKVFRKENALSITEYRVFVGGLFRKLVNIKNKIK